MSESPSPKAAVPPAELVSRVEFEAALLRQDHRLLASPRERNDGGSQ